MVPANPTEGEQVCPIDAFGKESNRSAGGSSSHESADAGGESQCRPSQLCRLAKKECERGALVLKRCHMRLYRRSTAGNRHALYSRGCGRKVSLKDVVMV